jgi:hypothetical protein
VAEAVPVGIKRERTSSTSPCRNTAWRDHLLKADRSFEIVSIGTGRNLCGMHSRFSLPAERQELRLLLALPALQVVHCVLICSDSCAHIRTALCAVHVHGTDGLARATQRSRILRYGHVAEKGHPFSWSALINWLAGPLVCAVH